MIKVKNLFLKYVRQYYALYDINLDIAEGEKVAFVGQKESGKTSLLRILVKLEKPTKGEIYIKNIPLYKVNYAEDVSLGYLPSTPIFFENKTVYENMLYVAKLQFSRPAQIESSINQVLMDFNIENLKDVVVQDLSLFEKYVVSIARLALRKIDILLIDDVFDNLQGEEQEYVIELVASKILTKECILLLATSNEGLAYRLCDRVITFDNGSIVKEMRND